VITLKDNEGNDFEVIRARLEEILGKETSHLVFKTLKVVYKIDEEMLIINPDLFREKIRMMLGPYAGEIVLKKLMN
jgi:hypothetical protein